MGILGNLLIGGIALIIAGISAFIAQQAISNAYHKWKDRNFQKNEEFLLLKPSFKIKIFPFPETIKRPDGTRIFSGIKYPYPLKEYVLLIDNTNKSSATPTDIRIKFFFQNTIKEIQSHPYIDSDFGSGTSMLRIYQETSPRNHKTTEQMPVETSLSDKFDFTIQKYKQNGSFCNTNIAEFHCEKWPFESHFGARVIVNRTEKPKIINTPEKMGSYLGAYWYEINGKTYKETVKGEIASNDDEFELAITQENKRIVDLVNQNIAIISNYVMEEYRKKGRGALIINSRSIKLFAKNNYKFSYFRIDKILNIFSTDKNNREIAAYFLDNYNTENEFIFLIIDRKNERWLYSQKLHETE